MQPDRPADWYVQVAVAGAPPLPTATIDRLRSLIGAGHEATVIRLPLAANRTTRRAA